MPKHYALSDWIINGKLTSRGRPPNVKFINDIYSVITATPEHTVIDCKLKMNSALWKQSGSPRRSASSGVISSETVYLMPEAVIRETVRGPFRGPVSREAQGDGLSPQILGRWGKIALGYSVSCIERINWIPQAYMRGRYTPPSPTHCPRWTHAIVKNAERGK